MKHNTKNYLTRFIIRRSFFSKITRFNIALTLSCLRKYLDDRREQPFFLAIS